MKSLFSLFLIALCTIKSFSQNFIYKGSQQYSATNTWSFPLTNIGFAQTVELTVAKTKTGGYLVLSLDVPFTHQSISGAVSLLLQNGKLITLSQRVVSDHVDGKSQVLYTITPSNYVLLKEYDIEKIRFSIYDNFMKAKENYTANNSGGSKMTFEPDFTTRSAKYNTAQEISDIQD